MSKRIAYLAGLMDGEGSFSIQVNIRTYKNKKNLSLNPKASRKRTLKNSLIKCLIQ